MSVGSVETLLKKLLDLNRRMFKMKANDLLEQIREANLSYLLLAASNMPMCSIRFEDPTVWKLLSDHGKDRAISGMHAAILMAGRSAKTEV